MIKEFQYSFEELSIESSEIEVLMGFTKGLAPEPFPDLISKGISESSIFCDIRGGFKTFTPAVVDTLHSTIQIKNKKFSPGKIVVSQLKDISSAALFICTAGTEISKQSQHCTSSGNTVMAYIFDTIGSLIADKAMDKIQTLLKKEVDKTGLNVTDRFSPGYCNWSVSEQQILFSLLPVNFCGVTLSPSSLMSPIKSVSGIIGIGADVKQNGYQCKWCDDLNCIYGRIKRKK